MPETAQQYISRIKSFLAGQDPVTVLAATPGKLRTLVQSLPEELHRSRPEPTRWSILEQVVHLSDVEIVVGYRVRVILGAEDGIPIPAFDQDKWQQALNYNSRQLAPTIDAFEAARANNVALYRSLTEAQWNKYGTHSERGKETVRDVITLAGGHDLNHLSQIEKILAQTASAAR